MRTNVVLTEQPPKFNILIFISLDYTRLTCNLCNNRISLYCNYKYNANFCYLQQYQTINTKNSLRDHSFQHFPVVNYSIKVIIIVLLSSHCKVKKIRLVLVSA